MRLFKLKSNVNWKYIVGEILLIFVGINLAIWFNNWNTSKQLKQDQVVAVTKIKGELKNNNEELTKAQKINRGIIEAYLLFQELDQDATSALIATPDQLSEIKKKHPQFYQVIDSIEAGDGKYLYQGNTEIVLEIPI